jgi:hypothetical protein
MDDKSIGGSRTKKNARQNEIMSKREIRPLSSGFQKIKQDSHRSRVQKVN